MPIVCRTRSLLQNGSHAKKLSKRVTAMARKPTALLTRQKQSILLRRGLGPLFCLKLQNNAIKFWTGPTKSSERATIRMRNPHTVRTQRVLCYNDLLLSKSGLRFNPHALTFLPTTMNDQHCRNGEICCTRGHPWCAHRQECTPVACSHCRKSHTPTLATLIKIAWRQKQSSRAARTTRLCKKQFKHIIPKPIQRLDCPSMQHGRHLCKTALRTRQASNTPTEKELNMFCRVLAALLKTKT